MALGARVALTAEGVNRGGGGRAGGAERGIMPTVLDLAEAVVDEGDGMVYLLHFERRYHHAGHYMGWTTNLEERLKAHASGNGSRLVDVVTEAGIGWELARVWAGGRELERKLKAQHHGPRLCPICQKGGSDGQEG